MRHVYFAIPVSAKRSDDQWSRLNDLLRLTLTSIAGQTLDTYTTYVCGHDRPYVLDEDVGANVKFIAATFPLPQDDKQRRRDKRRKRWEIAREVRAAGGGYFMFLDGDDLIHRDLVKHVVEDHNEVGYVITRGYALDYNNRRLAPIPGAFNKRFSQVCGSSGLVYFLPDDLPSESYDEQDQATLYGRVRNHKSFEDEPMRGDQLLSEVPFAAGVYTLNNSINLSDVLVRTELRQASLISKINKRHVSNAIEVSKEFSLGDFLTQAAP